ncbi:MAG TPA: hypothetical protein VK395_15095 [Gemmataceae bacterium]|nr:hypothetical protein [Gemmataceae bacterium]
MTARSPIHYPESRILAGWWKELAPLQPRSLWVGELLLHRVEALVDLQKSSIVDPLSLFVLKSLASTEVQQQEDVDKKLHIGLPLVSQILRRLQQEGLVLPDKPGLWRLSPLGRHALPEGKYAYSARERRVFNFVESEQPGRSPGYVNLHCPELDAVVPVPEEVRFDISVLKACVTAPPAWKEQHGFPVDVRELLIPCKEPTGPLCWQQIVVDRPVSLWAVLILTQSPAGGDRLIALQVQENGWVLRSKEPVFAKDGDWRDLLPELAHEPASEQWRESWRAFSQAFGLSVGEVNACTLERRRHLLRIAAPNSLIQRIRAVRNDLARGETWLLAGSGRLRMAARVDLVAVAGDRPRRS